MIRRVRGQPPATHRFIICLHTEKNTNFYKVHGYVVITTHIATKMISNKVNHNFYFSCNDDDDDDDNYNNYIYSYSYVYYLKGCMCVVDYFSYLVNDCV